MIYPAHFFLFHSDFIYWWKLFNPPALSLTASKRIWEGFTALRKKQKKIHVNCDYTRHGFLRMISVNNSPHYCLRRFPDTTQFLQLPSTLVNVLPIKNISISDILHLDDMLLLFLFQESYIQLNLLSCWFWVSYICFVYSSNNIILQYVDPLAIFSIFGNAVSPRPKFSFWIVSFLQHRHSLILSFRLMFLVRIQPNFAGAICSL